MGSAKIYFPDDMMLSSPTLSIVHMMSNIVHTAKIIHGGRSNSLADSNHSACLDSRFPPPHDNLYAPAPTTPEDSLSNAKFGNTELVTTRG